MSQNETKESFRVKRKAMAVFRKLFDNSERRGSLKWKAFEKAMGSLRFEVDGSTVGGSTVKFIAPETMAVTTPFEYDQPHDGELSKDGIRVLALELKRHFQWNMETFEEA